MLNALQLSLQLHKILNCTLEAASCINSVTVNTVTQQHYFPIDLADNLAIFLPLPYHIK